MVARGRHSRPFCGHWAFFPKLNDRVLSHSCKYFFHTGLVWNQANQENWKNYYSDVNLKATFFVPLGLVKTIAKWIHCNDKQKSYKIVYSLTSFQQNFNNLLIEKKKKKKTIIISFNFSTETYKSVWTNHDFNSCYYISFEIKCILCSIFFFRDCIEFIRRPL